MHAWRYKFGWILIPMLSLVPAFQWFLIGPVAPRFVDPSATALSLGQIFGMVGFAMFAINLTLAARLAWFEDLFYDLRGVYSAHRFFGGLAFIFILFHPLLLALDYLPSGFLATAKFLLPIHSMWAINTGSYALYTITLLLVLTFYLRLPYEWWKLTHKFLAAAFFLAVLHVFFQSNLLAAQFGMKMYLQLLTALAFLAIIYRVVLARYVVKKFLYEVTEVRLVSDAVVEIVMAHKEQPLGFTPGQFAFFRFRHDNMRKEVHPFSLSSAPQENVLRISAKKLGSFTEQLRAVPIGTLVEIEGPFGRFSYTFAPSKEQIWIAGGIGITPFLSMIRNRVSPLYHIDFYYATSLATEQIFADEIRALAVKNPSVRFIPYVSKEQGRLTGTYIAQTSGNIAGKDIFLCGPIPMMRALRRQLRKFGAQNKRIHSEEFDLV